MVVAILSAYASAGKIEIAGDQALNRARATVDKEQLYIQSVLFKQAGLLGGSWDPKAAKAKVDDFVYLRFVNEMKQNGFLAQLYAQQKMSGR